MKRVNLAIAALNTLFFGGEGRFQSSRAASMEQLPRAQFEAVKGLVQKIRNFGAPPPDACRQGALAALRAPASGYSIPEAGVGDVVDMQLGALSLPSGTVAGVDLSSQLPKPLREMVNNFEDWLLRDADSWAQVSHLASSLRPYNDPSLNRRSGYLQFLKHLRQCGILGLSTRVRGRVGAFTVAKKDKVVNGQKVKRQRLVLDCRQVNLQFKTPPHVELGSLSALTELELGDSQCLYTSGSDIQDCFYACFLPKGLEEFFCLASDLTPDEAAEVFGGYAYEYSQRDRVSPCITVLPMGFNWSFYLVQKLHEGASLDALQIPRSQLVLDGYPAPPVAGDAVISMPYCDNVHCMGSSAEACGQGEMKICDRLVEMGFTLHEHEPPSLVFPTLGGVIDGERGEIRTTASRAWNLIFAFEYLIENVVTTDLVQRLLGHAMVVCVLNRCGISVFRRLYDFIEKADSPRRLTREEASECRVFVGLIPLLVGDLRRGWSQTITATDASPEGYGVCERECGVEDVRSVGKWSERWRFRRLPPEEWQPRRRATGLNPFSDISTGGASGETSDPLEYVSNELFPEVPFSLMEPEAWHTVLMGRWRVASEHITLKEGRALVLAARRLARNSNNRRKKHLVIVDNMALAFAVTKGRATNFALLRIIQQLSALSLLGDFQLRVRWVPSEWNVADGPSRGRILPSSQDELGTSKQPANISSKPEDPNEGDSRELIGKCAENREQASQEGHSEGAGLGVRFKNGDYQERASFGREAREAQESGKTCPEEPVVLLRDEECFNGGGGPVPDVLQEIREFLPGARSFKARGRDGRRVPHGLLGPPLLRGEGVERGGENGGRGRVLLPRQQGADSQESQSPQGLAEGITAGQSFATSFVSGVWNHHGPVEETAQADGPDGVTLFRCVSPPRRGIHPDEEGLRGTRSRGWEPVCNARHRDSGHRGFYARQGGSLRQHHLVEQQGSAVAGGAHQGACPHAKQEGRSPFRLHPPDVSRRACSSRKRVGAGGTSSLPTPARRGGRGPELEGAGLQRREGARTVADRPVSETIRQDREDPENPQPVIVRRSGVLSMVTPQYGAGVQGSDGSSLNQRMSSDVFRLSPLPQRFALEVFAGTARVTTALINVGVPCFPIDICLFNGHDVLNSEVEHKILSWIRSGRILFIWLGMPSTSFSRTRQHDSFGPAPVRSDSAPEGLNGLSLADKKKVVTGNRLLYFTLRVIRTCHSFQVPYAVENPRFSRAWDMRCMQRFISQCHPGWVVFDFCQYGEPWRKPTGLLFQHIDFSALHAECHPQQGFCSHSKRPHICLKGRVEQGSLLTLKAQPYPYALATVVADVVAKALRGYGNRGLTF